MNILVVGAHFYNKGAHLMLKTVLEEIQTRSEHNLFLSPCSGTKEQIENLGYEIMDFPLKHVTAYRSFDIFFQLGELIKLLKKDYRGSVPFDKMDAVLDISGFAFSDQWGDKAVINVNKLITRCKKHGIKYVFLPQAFGPFSSEVIKREMTEVIEQADMLFARDSESYGMLRDLNPKSNIDQCPDITINLNSSFDTEDVSTNYSCIIPNERMLDQGREYWPDGKYLEYLDKGINHLLEETKNEVVILVHDKGQGDMSLGKEILGNYDGNPRVKLVYEDDPMKLKSIIGQANLLIGSRFHALVSSLSQDVPCVALGWSHKYQMLFKEYGILNYCFDVPDDKRFQEVLNGVTDKVGRAEVAAKIHEANIVLKSKIERMWDKVLNILEK